MSLIVTFIVIFFFNDTATTEIYTLSLHDALPISYLPRLLLCEIDFQQQQLVSFRHTLGRQDLAHAQVNLCEVVDFNEARHPNSVGLGRVLHRRRRLSARSRRGNSISFSSVNA